jgi:hypothetical protein
MALRPVARASSFSVGARSALRHIQALSKRMQTIYGLAWIFLPSVALAGKDVF